MAGIEEILPPSTSFDVAEKLLYEWLAWWYETPIAPAEMPDALHMRTVVYLIESIHAGG